MHQHRIPEQATTPPDLAPDVDKACRWVSNETKNSETSRAHALIRQILTTGQGHLESRDQYGRSISYDAGDLWDSLTESEESSELSALIGAVVWYGELDAAKRAQDLMKKAIETFVAVHADRMAKAAVSRELADRRVA